MSGSLTRRPFFTIGVTERRKTAAVPAPTPQIPRVGVQAFPNLEKIAERGVCENETRDMVCVVGDGWGYDGVEF